MAGLYDSLNIESYEIRITQLHPGPPGSTVECTLKKESLVDPPSYTALSYCWGDSADRIEIRINSVATRVTTSLEHALQRLRDLGVDRVWADALCINQADNQEKSLQIRLMKEIYSKADVTFSWLGDQGEDRAAEGFWFLGKSRAWRSLFEEIDTSYSSLGHREDPDTDKILPHDLEDSWQPYQDEVDEHILCPITMEDHENNHEGSDAPIPYQLAMENLYTSSTQCTASCKRCRLESCFEALADLFNSDYWRRRWIIQEIAAS
ncbi:HET-domain-containing protein [Apiospora arundinis]